MASTSNGAAEEPEPELGPQSSPSTTTTGAAAAATYDPRVYQPPHPDDRGDSGGGGGGPTKATKGGAKGKGKGNAGVKDKDGVGLDRCGNCNAEGDLRACKQCGAKAYCGESCQRVSGSGAR